MRVGSHEAGEVHLAVERRVSHQKHGELHHIAHAKPQLGKGFLQLGEHAHRLRLGVAPMGAAAGGRVRIEGPRHHAAVVDEAGVRRRLHGARDGEGGTAAQRMAHDGALGRRFGGIFVRGGERCDQERRGQRQGAAQAAATVGWIALLPTLHGSSSWIDCHAAMRASRSRASMSVSARCAEAMAPSCQPARWLT